MRHEYVDGRVYAMVGASDSHGLIALGIASELRTRLRGRPCQVFVADMKVRVESAREDRLYYPDVLVSCVPGDRERYYRRAPCLIVEVLSEATERLDRGEKLLAYRQLPALQDYLLVSQVRPLVELYRRDADWRPVSHGAGETVPLASLGLELAVDPIYEDVAM